MIDLHKQSLEDDKQYFARLIRIKDECGLSWKEIAQYLNEEFNSSYSPDTWRKRSYKLLEENVENSFEYDIKFEDKLELIKDGYKDRDENSQLNAMYRRLAREDSIKEIAAAFADKMIKFNPLTFKKVELNYNPTKEALLMISDWHYGIDYNGIFNTYNPEIAKKRIVQLVKETIEKCLFNNVGKLHVLNMGDLIAGNIHLPIRINSRMDVISQIMEVTELLAEALNELSSYFEIEYYSCIDNHSRIDPNKKDALQLESLTRITDWYLKDRLPNVTFHNNEYGLDIVDMEIMRHNFLGVHGDKDKQKNLIQKLTNYTKYHWDVICSAHLHHFNTDEDNRTMRISNGSLMGTDEYAHGLRLDSAPSQTLIIVSNDKPVECIYKIDLD